MTILYDNKTYDNAPQEVLQNVKCDCGKNKDDVFKIIWYSYPYTGGYCKVICPFCNSSQLFIDDYA